MVLHNLSSPAPRLPSISCASARRPRPFWNLFQIWHIMITNINWKYQKRKIWLIIKMASFQKVLLFPPARRTCGALRTCHPYDISCWRPHLKSFLNIWKRYHLWISQKIGGFVSRSFNFILTVVLLKTLQDKLKLYHWNFERMMDESSNIALKRLISKEEVFFLLNKAFRFLTLYEKKERESVFFISKNLTIWSLSPASSDIWHMVSVTIFDLR